ncbi:MAG: glycosyltransferase [Brevundimonas sp.]
MDLHNPPLLVDGPALDETYDIAYLTKYVGRLDSGIAFTDRAYLAGLAASAYATLVLGNGMPARYPADGLAYTTSVGEYRRRDPRLHLVNGLGSYVRHLPDGYLPEHRHAHKVAILHEEPEAFDFYATDVWNRRNVRDTLLGAHDGFVFVSERSRDLWVEYAGLDGVPTHVLPNTCAEEVVIAERFGADGRGSATDARGPAADRLDVVMVGTVQRLKAQLDVIEAVRRLRALRPDLAVHLRIVGRTRNQEYADEVRAAIVEHGLQDAVTVVGEVAKARALEHIAAADALVIASRTEAMPLVLLEAMQLGTPVVTTRVGGIPEVLDEEGAAFFEAGDVDALAQHLSRVADDRAWVDRLATAARARYWAEFSNARFRQRFDAALGAMTADAGLADPGGDLGATRFESDGPGALAAIVASGGAEDGATLRAWRSTVARHHAVAALTRVQISADAPQLEPLLALAAPLARLGLGVEQIDSARGCVVCVPAGGSSALTPQQVLRIVGEPVNVAAYAEHVRAGARRRARAQEAAAAAAPVGATAPAGAPAAPGAHAEKPPAQPVQKPAEQPALRRIARRARRRVRRASRTIARRLLGGAPARPAAAPPAARRDPARTSPAVTAPPAAPPAPAVVMVFNGPMQLMAALSLWDHAPAVPGARLVALVHSTSGAPDFAARLVALAQRTGRFDVVADISDAYRAVYVERPSAASVRDFGRRFRAAVGPGELAAIYVAAYMSARGQKFLYESAGGVPVRLFEDGLGSYVPKSIKQHDEGVVDRVTSRDCAVAHHIGLVESVDLMLTSVPVPQHYGADLPRVRFPRVSVGSYRIDYASFREVFGARVRAFAPDEVLLVTQNFADHLQPHEEVAAVERAVTDAVVGDLLDAGYRVVVRPHPRAGAPTWGSRWADDERVAVWDDQAMLPVEVLLDPGAPPALAVGATSSCLFYLGELTTIPVRRFPDDAMAALRGCADDEHAWMMDVSAAVLPALEARSAVSR